jgi:hypothetical protein
VGRDLFETVVSLEKEIGPPLAAHHSPTTPRRMGTKGEHYE